MNCEQTASAFLSVSRPTTLFASLLNDLGHG